MTEQCYCDRCGVPMKTSESICLGCGSEVPPFAVAASEKVDVFRQVKPLMKYWPFAAGAVILVLLAMLVSTSPSQLVTTNWLTGLLLISPLMAGLILTITKSQRAESASTWIAQWIVARREIAAESPSFWQKWLMRPACWMVEYATDFLDRVSDVHVRTGIKLTLYGYLLFLVVYLAIIVTVVVIGLVIIAAALWLISSITSDSDASQNIPDRTTNGPKFRDGESRKRAGFLGPYTEHTDKNGNVVSESREREGFLGPYTEHTDKNGNVVGESREREGFLGPYTEHTDKNGNVVGESREREGFLGPYTERTDKNGNVVGESREREGFLGPYTEHKSKKS